jgi:RimJ/RimL family protein N-acetyltransferase
MNVLIRQALPEDAEAYLALARQLDQETRFMMMEPGERTTTILSMRKRLQAYAKTQNQRIFVAENEAGDLIGLLGAQGGDYRRNYRTVHIFVGILQAYTGKGIGKRLFETMEAWARNWGAHRLELTVMRHNERGLALYQKMGFTIEGQMHDALWVDGQYIDEYIMGKILPPLTALTDSGEMS